MRHGPRVPKKPLSSPHLIVGALTRTRRLAQKVGGREGIPPARDFTFPTRMSGGTSEVMSSQKTGAGGVCELRSGCKKKRQKKIKNTAHRWGYDFHGAWFSSTSYKYLIKAERFFFFFFFWCTRCKIDFGCKKLHQNSKSMKETGLL